MLVTLNDLDIHSPFAGLFKCNPSHIYAAFYYISKKNISSWVVQIRDRQIERGGRTPSCETYSPQYLCDAWAGFDIWTKFGSVMQLGSLERIVCHILNFRTFNMAAAAVLNFEIVQVENVLNCDITPTVWRISNKFSRSIKRRAKC